jgi:hypothetical protein
MAGCSWVTVAGRWRPVRLPVGLPETMRTCRNPATPVQGAALPRPSGGRAELAIAEQPARHAVDRRHAAAGARPAVAVVREHAAR